MKFNNSDKPEFCNGCCYRHTCSHELEKCCYLVRSECILVDGYVMMKENIK